jgi:hypothetical protein
MATKGVLMEAIRKLEINNMELRKKLNLAHGKNRDTIASKIARNESMILDFQFRQLNE